MNRDWHYDWHGEMQMLQAMHQRNSREASARLILGWWKIGCKYPCTLCFLSVDTTPWSWCRKEDSGMAIFVELFEVRERWRGTGLAEACVKSLYELYPHENFMLHSVPRAESFWRRMGFKRIPKIDDGVLFRGDARRKLRKEKLLPVWPGSCASIDEYNQKMIDEKRASRYKEKSGQPGPQATPGASHESMEGYPAAHQHGRVLEAAQGLT